MRVFFYEIKKIFRPAVIFFALIFSMIIFFISAEQFGSYRLKQIYAVDKSTHWNDSDTAQDYCAEEYRTYKWYIDNYGYKMNEETVEKLRALEFPLLENIISTRKEFAEMDVGSLKELMELHDKYFDNKPYLHIFSGVEYPSAPPEQSRENYLYINRIWILGDILSCQYSYCDKYISESEILTNAGFDSFADYEALKLEMEYEDFDFELCGFPGYTEEQKEMLNYYSAEFDRIKEEYIKPDLKNRNFDAEIDAAREEYMRFELIYKLLQYYEECKKDRFYLLNGNYCVTYESSHTYNLYFRTYWDRNSEGLEGNSAKFRNYHENIDERLTQLGDGYFNVRITNISEGMEFALNLFMTLAAALSVFLILPYAAEDKLSNVIPVQYSSKTGRKTLKIQFLAVLAVSFLLTAVCNTGILILTANDLYAEFYNLPMNSYCDSELFWFDMNMYQYLAAAMVFNYLISAAFAAVSFFIGRCCGNYVSAFISELPLVIAAFTIYQNPFHWLFSLPESFWEDWLWLGGIALTALMCISIMILRNRRRMV